MRTAAEIRAEVRTRLKMAAERVAQQNSEEENRKFDAIAPGETAPLDCMLPTDPLEVETSWTEAQAFEAAGLARVPADEWDVTKSEVNAFLKEAHARQALREMAEAEVAVLVSAYLHDGKLTDLDDETLVGIVEHRGAEVLEEEITNALLSMQREIRDKLEEAAHAMERTENNLDGIKGGVDFLRDNEKRKIKKRSKTAKANPRRGVDDQMTDAQWNKFLRGLDEKLKADKQKPPRQRQGQQGIIEKAIADHNDASESKITIGWQGVKKRLQRR